MKQFIRAEDFDIVEDRMILGGRVLEGDSVVSAHVEKRVSLELLGFYLALGICLALLLAVEPGPATLGILIVGGLLGLGARREIVRPYVFVLELYQLGIFEVRGFTEDEAVVVEEFLDNLRRGAKRSNLARRSSFLAGSIN